MRYKPPVKDLKGMKFGRLTPVEYEIHKSNGKTKAYWLCRCSCGNEKWVASSSLVAKHVRSCGCLSKEYLKIGYRESSRNRIYRRYKGDAKRRGYTFNLSISEFECITGRSCAYCGTSPRTIQKADGHNGCFVYNGIDRVDGDLGYVKGNCVPCCKTCNYMKGKLTHEEFLSRIDIIKNYQKEKQMGKQYCMYIGRWQPYHFGHLWLVRKSLDKGKPVLIAIRDIPPDDKNPFTAEEVQSMLECAHEGEDVKVIIIPDIESVNYGRGVGYGINEFQPPEDIKRISATQIRAKIKEEDDGWKEYVSPKVAVWLKEYYAKHSQEERT